MSFFVNFDRHVVGFTRVDQTSKIVVNVVILVSLHFNSSGFNNNSGLVGIGCREDGERMFFAIKSERNCNPLENLKQFWIARGTCLTQKTLNLTLYTQVSPQIFMVNTTQMLILEISTFQVISVMHKTYHNFRTIMEFTWNLN